MKDKFFHVNFLICLLMMLLMCLFPQPCLATDLLDQQEVVDKARYTLATFAGHPNLTWFQKELKKAKAVFIVPKFLKGSFFFGGAEGVGVFLVRHEETSAWSDPAFYTMVEGSFGLQIGAQASEVILLVMTRRGVQSMLKTHLKLGLEATIAAGPLGGGIEGGLTPFSVDLIALSRSRGIFGGLSLGGTILVSRGKWNHSYYSNPVEPQDILLNQTARNHYSIGLLDRLTTATGGLWSTNQEQKGSTQSDTRLHQHQGCLDVPVTETIQAEHLNNSRPHQPDRPMN